MDQPSLEDEMKIITRVGSARRQARAAWGVGMGLVAAASCAGCSTVRSIDVGKAAPSERANAYLNYAVSKSLILVQLTAAESGAGGGDAASASKATTTAAAPAATAGQTFKITGTITSGSGASASAAPASAAPGDPSASAASDASACGLLAADYKNDATYFAGQAKTYASLRQSLDTLEAAPMAKADRVALAKSLDDYEALDAVRQGKFADATTRTLAQLTALCPPKVKVALSQQIVPDWTRTFAVKMTPNVLFSDQVNLKVDSNGFLTSASVATQDQSAGVASSLAGIAGEFIVGPAESAPAALGAAVRRGQDQNYALLEKGLEIKGLGLKTATENCAIPLVADGSKAEFQAYLAELRKTRCDQATAAKIGLRLGELLPAPGALPPLPGGDLPISLAFDLDQLDSPQPEPASEPSPKMTPLGPELAKQAGTGPGKINQNTYPLTLEARCSHVAAAAAPSEESPDLEATRFHPHPSQRGAVPYVYNGLIMSTSRACRFRVMHDGTTLAVADQSFWVQDSRYLRAIPLKRIALVTHTVGYDFSGGQATDATENRPSVVAAAAALPGDLVGAFFSGITASFTNKKGVIDNQTAGVTAQTNLLTAQTNYLKAKADLKTANGASTSN